MLTTILRKEHKNNWEKRSPYTPEAVKNLINAGYIIDVESSDIRIFNDKDFADKKATIIRTPENHQLVIGIKEPPIDSIQQNQVHLCFSHTIKGQDYNMPLLQRYLDKKATLLDYELMADESGKRTIAFGEHAGIAGTIDSLYVAGQKLQLANKTSDLSMIKQTYHYANIKSAKQALSAVDLQSGYPVRVLILGSGNVGRGSEKVCQWLGLPKLDADKFIENELPTGSWYTVVSSRHINQRIAGGSFDYDEYINCGKDTYLSKVEQLLGRFDILIQASYWTDFFPRHLNNQQILINKDKMPWVIGDISCDINGSFACTQKVSTIEHPAFSYFASDGTMIDEISWDGTTVMSIDNLPCELSEDASEHFSVKLEEYSPYLMDMDLNDSFEDLSLPDELKKSVIVYKGELTANFQYLKEYL